MNEQMITIGRIIRAHGVRGEVKIEPLTDHIERFSLLHTVSVEKANGQSRKLTIEMARPVRDQVILKFRTIDQREQAASLGGALIKIENSERLPLEPDHYYIFGRNFLPQMLVHLLPAPPVSKRDGNRPFCAVLPNNIFIQFSDNFPWGKSSSRWK